MEAFLYPGNFFGSNSHYGHHGHNNHHHHHHQGNANATFTPLFRLLDDFDRYTCARPGARATPPAFQPKFDVRESDAAYELHGELAGAQRDNIHIEFTDPSTILIRGRIERSLSAGTPAAPAGAIAQADETRSETSEDDASEDYRMVEKEDTVHQNEQQGAARAPSPLRATVQDESEAKADEEGTEVTATPTSSVAETARDVGHHGTPRPAPKKETLKYWITERSVGEFSRTFTFPSRVEPQGVKANLKDGILTVIIPKSRKHEARRIHIA